jgi:hypothetical protein
MKSPVGKAKRAFTIWLSAGALILHSGETVAQEPCTSVLECAQKSLEAALAAKVAAQSAASRQLPKVTPVHGKELKCNSYFSIQPGAGQDRWSNAQVEVECPANTVRVSGGCSFTCFGLEHTDSVPTDKNGWRCGAISNDPQRTFHSVALCMQLGGGQ